MKNQQKQRTMKNQQKQRTMKNQQISTRQELMELAADMYKIANITYGDNGYPKGLGDHAIIGFDNFKEAEEFAEKNGLETGLFKKRDGWSFYEHVGHHYKPLTVDDYLRDLGDNCHEYVPDDEVFRDRLRDMVNNDESFEVIEDFVTKEIEWRREYEDLDNETQALILLDSGDDTEVVDREMMDYREDVWHWAVGVFVPKDWGTVDDDE